MTEDSQQLTVSESGRVKNVTIVKPIVYGSHARYFTKKRDEDGHTHGWKIFVKPYYVEDTTKWIRKVTFKLHESIQNATRVVERPPYAVEETGWGEFEVIIRIHFVDPQEKPVTAYHILKLFQNDPQCISGKKLVVSEYYDEIVFNEPSPLMLNALQQGGKRKTLAPLETDFENKKERVRKTLLEAKEEVGSEILDLKESLKEAQVLRQKYSQQILKLESENGSQTEDD